MNIQLRTLLAAVLMLTLMAPAANAQITIGTTDYGTNLEAAVNAAVDGDVINVPDGLPYTVASTIVVDVGVTIQGQSEAGTVVEIATGAGWGLNLKADNITIQDISFKSVEAGAKAGYLIHAADPPTVFTNLAIRRVTFFGNPTSGRRTGLDIHGYDGVILEDVTSRDASSGNGIQFTGCTNVTATGITTSGNAWGSLAVYVSQLFTPSRASDNVVIDGMTFSGSDTAANIPQVFSQGIPGVDNTNVSVTGWDHIVRNTDFRAEAPEYRFFVDTEPQAIAYALSFVGFESASSIERVSDGNFIVAAGMSIQAAIDAAPAAGTVEVGAGTFQEQLEIGKDLTLQGAGTAATTILSPVGTLPVFFTTSSNNYPVVYVHDASDVTVQGLTVDGNEQGAANGNRFYGIAYRNAGGTVDQVRTVRTRAVLQSGNVSGGQGGNGIYAYNNDGVTRTLNFTDNVVEDFQKNGITVNSLDGTATTVNITGNTVNGQGVLSAEFGEPAQNGIQVYGSLIDGSIDGNTISGIAYDNTLATTKWVATTILDFFSGADITNNIVPSSQVAVYKYSAFGAISGNDITVDRVGERSWGIIATDPPRAVPQPDVEAGKASELSKATTLTVVVDGNTVTFSDPLNNANTFGLEADAGYTPDDLDVTFTNNTVTGFEVGVDIYQSTSDTGVFTNVAVNQNDLAGNDIGVRSNVDYLTVDASCNWYGDLSGPFEATLNPTGTGSPVEGDVSFAPWLDAAGGNCDQYGPNFASAGPAPSELNACSDCISVPVDLTRGDTSAARGVSVTFALSANLELCGSTPLISSGPGSFYGSFVNDVQEFLLDNGDGTYTYDTAILGTNCGPTTGGELFTIPVSFAAGLTGDQTGTIDIVGVTFRDCANAPLPLLPGPGTTVEIDLTAPGVVTDLAATQVKSGNDSDGTTKIDLSWTLPGDADLTGVRLFRKGFGNYPEYDDLGGAVPTTPADPIAALGDGWTELTVTPLAPTATSYTDEPAMRDFWYYVAFVEDECYVSAVSGQTGGTLNYHLGDVVPGAGNNLVFTGDISALGGAYGTFDGDVDYLAKVDVGPTTDFSVDARPTTDNQIQFEDLIVFAINYNSVGRLAPVQPAIANAVSLVEPTELTVGEEIRVPMHLASDGTIQGLSVALDWNDAVLEYVGWTAGDLASGQNRTMPVFSPKTGVIDAAVMGVSDLGIAGEGTLAHLRFRVKAEGAADLRFESVDARSTTNEKITLDGTLVQEAPNTPALVSRSTLRSNVPNPFNPSTKVRFALAEQGHVSVRIFDVKGRLVRTLVDAPMTAGEHEIQWNGTDDAGRTVGSGTYLMRMDAPDATASRRLMLVK